MEITRAAFKRPATPRQRAYAHAIAKGLGITGPSPNAGFEEVSKFISAHVDRYNNLKDGKRKNIDSAGVIAIENDDTVFDVLDKFFAALERFDKQDGTTEYWTEDGAALAIHASLGECNAMVLLKASIAELEKDEQESNKIVEDVIEKEYNKIVEEIEDEEDDPFD